ncbi:MAG: hypothetical protein H7Z76_08530 [Methylotenera sp.]|nr:hypothetical protein [Flavobacterium sp.]
MSKKINTCGKNNKRFMLYEGTGFDNSSALIEAGNKVSGISDVSTLLNCHYQLQPVMAKSYSYLNGTPRLFEFKISEHPISEIQQEEIDLGIPLPLQRTRLTHRHGRAIRCNLFSQRTMTTLKKGFPLLSLMQNKN